MPKKIITAPVAQIAILSALILIGMTTALCPWAPMERAHYDFWAAHFRAPENQPIEIVAIDEKSLGEIGDWPWPRTHIARMVRLLSAHGAAAQGLCLLFAHPDVNSGLSEIRQLRQTAAAQTWPGGKRTAKRVDRLIGSAERHLNMDAALITAVRRAKNIVLPIRLVQEDQAPPDESPLSGLLVINSLNAEALPTGKSASPGAMAGFISSDAPGPIDMQAVVPTFEDLAKKAGALGHLNLIEDSDGTLRRVPLLLEYKGRLFPTLALQLALKSIDAPLWDISIESDLFAHPSLTIKHLRIPTDGNYGMLINFHRHWTAERTYAFADVLNGAIDPAIFKDKIVLVGPTAPEAAQMYRIRANEKAAGVEIQANLLAGLLSNLRLSRPSWAQPLELLALLYFAFFLVFVIPRVNLTLGASILGVFGATWYGLGLVLLMGYGYWIKIYGPILLAVIGFGVIQLTILSQNRLREKSEANKALGLSYQGQGMLDMAYEKYMQCPVEDETTKSLLYNLALDFERKRMFNKALAIYEQIWTAGPFKDIDKRRERLKPLDSTVALSGAGSRSETPLMTDDTAIKPTFGRYEILRELGRGSMGTVYLGRDPKINREVAIKTLDYSEVAASELPEVKARFFREAEAAGKLAHPNIVSIFDVGEEHDMAYIAMELLLGDDLSQHCRSGNLLPFDSVLSIVADVSAALAYAHNQGVVHRDIKPANIMVLEDGRVKVTDFGIAQVIDASQTNSSVILGTPNYMSPEQVTGANVDGRSDLFSLGVVFYELMSGTKPFKGDSINAIMYAISHKDHTPLQANSPEAPAQCIEIIDRLLAKQASERFTSADELLEAVKTCQAELE